MKPQRLYLFKIVLCLTMSFLSSTLADADTTKNSWVKNGTPNAVIVTADKPFPIAQYAAQELAYHVKLATGAQLAVTTESEVGDNPLTRIYIGKTEQAGRAQLGVDTLPAEHCLIRSVDGHLFIAGNDGPGDALDSGNIHSGTLWGVYEVLERTLNVRWLWPGEAGIIIDKKVNLDVAATNEILKPHFVSRIVHTYVPLSQGKPVIYYTNRTGQETGLAFSSTAVQEKFLMDQHAFLRRHRVGASQDPNYSVGHSFSNWWKEYGQTHPEWFQLLPIAEGEFAGMPQQTRAKRAHGRPQNTWQGRRGPDDLGAGSIVSMCVSNREFHREIIRRWQEERAKNPTAPVQLGENDIWGLCVCDECVKLDAPQKTEAEVAQLPGSVPGLYQPFDAGRRYAWFYNEVHKLAAEIDPNVKVLGYIYLNYFVAPQDIELNPNIILTYVPWGGFYYPRDPREQVWLEDQWVQWRNLGATLLYRPNYVLDGGSMPLNYTHQMMDQFDFFIKHGAIGTSFDARVGQWSAQGATMYALLRKHTQPDKTPGQLLQEYYTAFGPAAQAIKAYFDFWEAHTTINGPNIPQIMERNVSNNLLTYARATHELYPVEAIDKAQQILDIAKATVEGQEEYARRVEYIQLGLTHARKSRDISALFADKNATLQQRQAAFGDIAAFRRATEHLNIANYAVSADEELRSFSKFYDFSIKPDVTIMPADTVMKP